MSYNNMYKWADELFPINRSITGEGARQTLNYIRAIIPELELFAVSSGTQVFDWIVPQEWNISEAWIEHESGDRVVDFSDNNLHIVSYSNALDEVLDLEELQHHLHSLPELPEAIPYVTAYYTETWGFCIQHDKRLSLKEGNYHVFIDSEKTDGELNYGEVFLKGETDQEILLSTYICHPSMANNELSGPVVAVALVNWIKCLDRRYSYRIVFCPETIGAVSYISRNLEDLQKNVIAGFVLTCMGDNNGYSYLPSRTGNTLADKVAKHVMKFHSKNYETYTFLERGSDERQYCSPLVDLPVCSVMRTMYTKYPEYHTSLDNMDLISQEGLEGGYQVIQRCIQVLEMNYFWKATQHCEPQLGKRGLYDEVSSNHGILTGEKPLLVNILAYADGTLDLIDIAEILGVAAWDLIASINKLADHKLIIKA